jgi:hypothetical protein
VIGILFHLLLLLLLSPQGRRKRGGLQQSWRNFMRSRNMEEDMAEDRHLWQLGVDGWLLAV